MALVVTILWAIASAQADEEVANRLYIRAGQNGTCYAKAVPSAPGGVGGTTTIYSVEADGDKPLYSFSWYASALYIECPPGTTAESAISLVRIGEWPRGRKASGDQLAIAFYVRNQLVKQYSTLDIAGSPENVAASKSHYRVIDHVLGYGLATPKDFQVVTTDSRKLSFDPFSGDLMQTMPVAK
jgi:hypothetical protein